MIRANRPDALWKIGVSIANDSRESIRSRIALRIARATKLNSEDMGFEGAFFPCDDSS